MDILNQYGSDNDGSDNGSETTRRTPQYAQPVVRQYKVDTAPDTIGNHQTTMTSDLNSLALLPPAGPGQQREMRHNMEYAQMMQPLVGPADPDGTLLANKTTTRSSSNGGGTAEKQAIEEAAFREQERLFWRHGRARDPSVGAGAGAIVSNNKGNARAADTIISRGGGKRARRRRDKAGDPAVVRDEGAYQGPWAQFESEKRKKTETSGPTDAQRAEHEQRMAAFAEAGAADGAPKAAKPLPAYVAGQAERTELHAQTERDYQGRTYMHVPDELRRLGNAVRSGDEASAQTTGSAPPSRLVKEWKGAHAGGASAVRFIPSSGHLLLSSGMDGMVKLFDAHESLALLRSYAGHSLGVRDISFAPDGRSFLSSSYDGFTKLWDTETGACTAAFAASNRSSAGSSGRRGASPNVARFYPEDTNVFLAGLSDKRIVQWDARAREATLEYNQHLGAVNSLTFFDSSRRFVSSSDDKTMRVWEFGIPVVIKLIADAAMHSVPAVALHPSQRWLVGQSMDNRIVVYGTGDRIKPHRRKVFAGHLVAGFACQPTFSPDGGVLASGDAEGRIWCWDWRSTSVVARWNAHDKVAICADWHPCLPSRLATCSWDGSIKYWE
ncbi:hypothetical protein IWW48_002902 [Coemansia sp. RSA 1200]|nr:hypothetical protein IWW48_002902 [Coemansia sp. RSA 1200]